MDTSLLSKFLYTASLIVIVGALIQWYFLFPDMSQLAFGFNIALTIIIGAYIHSAFRNIVNDIKESNKIRNEQVKALDKALNTTINYIREVENQIKGKKQRKELDNALSKTINQTKRIDKVSQKKK